MGAARLGMRRITPLGLPEPLPGLARRPENSDLLADARKIQPQRHVVFE